MKSAVIEKLDDEMPGTAGGAVEYAPGDRTLTMLGIDDMVRFASAGNKGTYYWVNDCSTWKAVDSGAMLSYVEKTLGTGDNKSVRLRNFCRTGRY